MYSIIVVYNSVCVYVVKLYPTMTFSGNQSYKTNNFLEYSLQSFYVIGFYLQELKLNKEYLFFDTYKYMCFRLFK